MRRFKRLMLQRIDWTAAPAQKKQEQGDGGEGEENDDEYEIAKPQTDNTCHLVWEVSYSSLHFTGA